jgi:hypothetical protein
MEQGMTRIRGLALVASLLLASVMFVGDASAGGSIDALKAREAEIMMELAKVRAQIKAKGGTAMPEVAATAGYAASPAGSQMPADDGHSLLYSGTVELGAGGAFADCSQEDEEACPTSDVDDHVYPYLVGSGRASVPIGDNASLQFDAEGWATFTDRGGDDEEDEQGEDNLQTSFSGAIHATWRDPSTGAAGIFGQLGSSNGGENENATFWLVGGEAQLYLGDFTLYGQGGYFEADDETEDNVITDAFFLRGVGRWSLHPMPRIEGEFSWVDGESNAGPGDDPADDLYGFSWGLRADRIVTGHPISVFAGPAGRDPGHAGCRSLDGFHDGGRRLNPHRLSGA